MDEDIIVNNDIKISIEFIKNIRNLLEVTNNRIK